MKLYRFCISFENQGNFSCTARSSSAARYQAYQALYGVGYEITFKDFLSRCHTLHMGPVS